MARFGRPRNLSCFYCGKRSSLKFDGSFSNFLCLYCDATNYLDEHGEITDPPVATDRETAPPQYAMPQPAASTTDNVFCEKCLKNQRLFTASLAQYLPDDPSHPDYEELDRNYYRYRRNLEKRYPQVCDDCAGKVQQRIRQAGYTAKTDHLRRMMDRSRGRKATQKTSPLDFASSVGRWLWRGGLLAQLLWHLVCVTQALERPDNGMYDPDDTGTLANALSKLQDVVSWLPEADALIRLSITAAVASAWWNPHFVQFNRGFTRHLLGFTRWYSFQGLIIFFRVLFRSVLSLDGGNARSQSAQLSAHGATAAVMCFIYILAGRSITVDTTPLFRADDKPLSPSPRRPTTPAQRKEQDSKTFSELFNEALDATPSKTGAASHVSTPDSAATQFVPPSQRRQQPASQTQQPHEPVFSNMSISNPPEQFQYAEEMDWSPSQPQHRAFRDSSDTKAPNRPFGQSPTQPDGNPFWYKVPAAPTNPAHRLRNPPNMPVMRKKPTENSNMLFSRKPSDSESQNRRRRSSSGQNGNSSSSITFKNPSFFAPEDHDEANSLADMLGQSFSLSQESNKAATMNSASARPRPSMWTPQQSSSVTLPRRNIELYTLLVVFPFWLLVTSLSIPYKMELQGVALVVAGIIALGGTGDAAPSDSNQAPNLTDAIFSALGILELAALCWIGWETWTTRIDVTGYGTGVLGVMLAHQTWKSFT